MKSTDVTTDDHFWVNTDGERVPIAGGNWHYGSYAGLCALHLADVRGYSCDSIGGRVAYAEI
jgi:hypothetical protein